MQLSKHFTLREMTNSMTAQRKGIDNTPGSAEIKNLGDLCYEVLEPLRAHFDKPVTITSGYRSEALCEAIGSKKTSQHAKGQAVDLEIFGVPNIKKTSSYFRRKKIHWRSSRYGMERRQGSRLITNTTKKITTTIIHNVSIKRCIVVRG